MSLVASPQFLRAVLAVDAASGVATALLHLAFTDPLAAWFGMPSALVAGSGWALWGFVALAAWAAWRQPAPVGAVWLVIGLNFAWAAACVALLLSGAAATTLGQGYLVLQAAVVVVFAELEWLGLRRSPLRGWA